MNNFHKFVKKNSCMIISILCLLIIVLSLQDAGTLPEFFNSNSSDPTIVAFHANWCGHCKTLMPHWDRFEKEFNGNNGIVVTNIESEEDKQLMKKHGIQGFPTIKYCPKGLHNTEGTVSHEGARTYHGLVEFFNQCTGSKENFSEELEVHQDTEEEEEGYTTESFYNY